MDLVWLSGLFGGERYILIADCRLRFAFANLLTRSSSPSAVAVLDGLEDADALDHLLTHLPKVRLGCGLSFRSRYSFASHLTHALSSSARL